MMVDFKCNVGHDFEVVYQKLKSEMMLNKQISGDLPIYIQTYNIECDNEVSFQIKFLCERLNKDGIKALHIDIYEMALYILEAKNKLNIIKGKESGITKNKLHITLNTILSEKTILDHLLNTIKGEDVKMVLFSGFGTVFPYIRANTILNKIEPLLKGVSFIFFYPGKYNNESLVLFDKIKDGNYYRAHNLKAITI